MPNPNYVPTDYRYYDAPLDYPGLSKILGNNLNGMDRVDQTDPLQYAAFVKAQLPHTAENKETVTDILKRIDPNYTAPKNANGRRALSEQARQEIVDLAVELKFRDASRLDNSNTDRTLRCLLLPGTDEATKSYNDQKMDLILGGSAEELGAAFEERIRSAKEWLDRSREDISDRDLLGNLKQIHISHDIVSNAQNILALAEKGTITISDEYRNMLTEMEREAPRMDQLKQRVKLIASPYYEFADPMELAKCNFGALQKLTVNTDHLPVANDFLMTLSAYVDEEHILLRDQLTAAIREDFDMSDDTITIDVVDWTQKRKTLDYTAAASDTVLTENLGNSNVLVSSANGGSACYRLGKNGRVEKITAEQMSIDFIQTLRANAKEMTEDADEANRGLFVSSNAYAAAAQSMEDLFEAAKASSTPPTAEENERIEELLRAVVQNCEAYMQMKGEQRNFDPNTPGDNIGMFKNVREEKRYGVIEQARDACQKLMHMSRQQSLAQVAEKEAVLSFHSSGKGVEFPAHPRSEVIEKVHNTFDKGHMEKGVELGKVDYKASIIDTRIPASDLGNAADELRESIHRSLQEVAFPKPGAEFDDMGARNIMSNMVVLEMVKAGRTLQDGKIIGGPVEKALAENPAQLVQAIRNDKFFQKVTETVTLDSLSHFIMSDGAKNIARHMANRAVQPKAELEEAIIPEVKPFVLGGK